VAPAREQIAEWKEAPVMGSITVATAAAKASSSSSSTFLILIVVIFVGFYFLMIRPQRQRQQRIQQQQNQVTPGARVRTTAGMYATVVAVDGDDVILEVAPGVEARFMKRAIMDVVSEPEADADAETEGGFHEDHDGEEEGGFHEETTAAEDDDTPKDDDWDVKDDWDKTDSDVESGASRKD
jgi:preprotein translocase subunit YajC